MKISCETEPHVIVIKCNFYTNREEKKIKTSSSCELDLTGAEVLRWAAVQSPESLNIYCYQCWAVTSYCNLVTVIILLFAVTSSVITNKISVIILQLPSIKQLSYF